MKARRARALDNEMVLLSDGHRLEYVRCVMTLVLASGIWYLITKLIDRYYNPDISKILDHVKSIAITSAGSAPEPKEQLLFMSAIVSFTVLLPTLYHIINKFSRNISSHLIQAIFPTVLIGSTGFIVFVGYMGLSAPNPFSSKIESLHDNVSKTNMDFYTFGTFIDYHPYLFLCALFPGILACFLYSDRINSSIIAWINKVTWLFVFSCVAVMIVTIFLISMFKFPYTYENKYDFNAVFYSVVQVYNGLPLLVDGFNNTYGLYPHFVVPFLKPFGLSVLGFSVEMALLSSISFAIIFFFLGRHARSVPLVLFGFTTIFFNTFMYGRIIANYDPYFAGCPIRWIFPTLLLLFSTLYLVRRSRKLYYSSYFVFALGILWNPDFGMMTFLSLVIFYSYLEFNNQSIPTIIRNIAFHILCSVLALSATILLYILTIKITFGRSPNFLALFATMKTFSVLGFNMLPMPSSFHPWMLIAITYMVGLLLSLKNIFSRTVTDRSAIIFLLTVTGVGSFSYYVGRSHNGTLIGPNWAALILLTIFADELLLAIRQTRLLVVPFSLLVLVLSFSVFQTAYDYDKILVLITEEKNKKENQFEDDLINENASIIGGLTIEKEKVLIFSRSWYLGLYHHISNTLPAIHPGIGETILKTDYNDLLSLLLKNSTIKIFFEPELFRFYNLDVPISLASLYDAKSIGRIENQLLFFSKKKENSNGKLMLPDIKNSYVHELLDKSFENRLSWAHGNKGSLTLGKQFCVDVIFRPSKIKAPPFSNEAAILCNAKEEKGFVLQQNGAVEDQYIFGFNKRGAICPVVLGEWNYLSISVNGNKIRTYSNGILLGEVEMQSDFVDSDEPLYVGTYKSLGGVFMGDIKELRIAAGQSDPRQVATTWEAVRRGLE